MQGGLFGLNSSQKMFLYATCLAPSLIVVLHADFSQILLYVQLVYLISTAIYVRYLSLQKSLYPYLSHELTRIRNQVEKGGALGLSAFLLITIYGIMILRVGKIVLPGSIQVGETTHAHLFAALLLSLLNPLSEEIFWRLFLPKTFQATYDKSEVIHISYLLYHFAMFSRFLGFWRAIPFVGTFFSVGRSMSHISTKYGIVAAIITHYGITLGGFTLLGYVKLFETLSI